MTGPAAPQASSSVRNYRGKGAGEIVAPTGSQAVCFTIPGQPLPKQRARVMKGYSYTPKETVAAEKRIADYARIAQAKPTRNPIHLVLRFFRGDLRRVDLDNLAKLVQDALNGVAYADDSQIVLLTAAKGIDREFPRTEIEVRPCPVSPL